MLQQLVWFLHMFCAFCIIILVLLQHGKGAEAGASLGAGASQTIFGSQGSGSFLTKITTMFALFFAITSISLSFFINKKTKFNKISDTILQQKEIPVLQQDNLDNPIKVTEQPNKLKKKTNKMKEQSNKIKKQPNKIKEQQNTKEHSAKNR